MFMHLTYEFELDGTQYEALNAYIGETCDIETEKQDIESLKVSAICHALDLTIDEYEANAVQYDNAQFSVLELE